MTSNELHAEVSFNTYQLYMKMYDLERNEEQKEKYWKEAMYWQDQYIENTNIDFSQLGIQISS
jgi:hypothetical protein